MQVGDSATGDCRAPVARWDSEESGTLGMLMMCCVGYARPWNRPMTKPTNVLLDPSLCAIAERPALDRGLSMSA